ncbi:general transcription factor 3C polypeptide 1 isoform 2-T2 [Anomaloglossus baeobatrachus]|uniref:general transcription factor 3C polypeptide 1 isoform X2 n=1 Tax=Anomaloglossus baeobatrachus TaxID=238106 RepID=UPI003F503ECE
MELLQAVLDEVALEGLDGITVPALWLRLQDRVPAFPLTLDAATKQLIWRSLVRHPELHFYELPTERQPLVISNRYEEDEFDLGTVKVLVGLPEDLYPYHPVTENKSGIQGSCQYFQERILVTELLKTESVTCEAATDRWGEKLVIVGSQTLRYRALIGWEADPALELPESSYCILEKVGRSRWQGEIQKDLQGTFKVDAGKIHYFRRALDKYGLITMQSCVVKLQNGGQQHSLLLLLKRFHIDRRNKYDLLSERVSQILIECPNKTETLVNLREGLAVPDRLFKRLYHTMANAGIIKIITIPLHEIQPQAEHCKTKRGTDIMIRCMTLLKEYQKKDEDNEAEEDVTSSLPVEIIYEKDMLTQTYELIENRGTKGISQREIKMAMNVGKLEARMMCRLLERHMLIKGFMEDEGRQRTTKYISHVFVEESELRRQILEEKAKSDKLSMLNMTPTENIGEDQETSPESKPSEEASEDEQEELRSSKRSMTEESGSFLGDATTSSTPLPTSRGISRIHLKRTSSMDVDKMALSENDCSLDSFQETNLSANEDDDEISVIEEFLDNEGNKGKKSCKSGTPEKSRETVRLLKRRNIIVEAVKNLRLVENLYTLQKMILEQEKQDGVSTKCCKKSIRRLVQRLSHEGLVRLYHTVVVQDGISKKVEFVVHPSINPSDPLVKSAIEQIRFRISNSTSGNRSRSPVGQSGPGKAETDDPSKEKQKGKHGASPGDTSDSPPKQTDPMEVAQLKNYHPVIVYVDEVSWVRCVPPAPAHSEYGAGWVLVSDILLCLPLSIFIQIVQVSYKVDDLEEYLNDPIKKHTLIRYLPRSIRQQLLYKRRYVFSVIQGLQRLNWMGLLQFGPSEKFQDQNQVFFYVKKNATIVDTTVCEPHYNIAQASHPFEKRSYSLESFQDVDNYWFDLQFVCLNTPLGVVRCSRVKKANPQDESVLGPEMEAQQEDRQNQERKFNIMESIPGSKEVVDDGSIPGDGLGAGGLESSFYSHLKRNWIWISYIINHKKNSSSRDGVTLRLQTFLNKHNLPLGSRGDQKKFFGDISMSETGELVQMVKEATANRNKRVHGGKSQKRKRSKKESEKKPKSKKMKKETNEDKIKKNRYHDEADQSALQRMTRMRVAWTSQEDGLLMLCRITSNILNRKVKRPFVPWQVVRDIMHANMDESLDKTSHSIGRRARYIIKNPQTYLNYKVCLAEVYQDKALFEEFMNRKENYDDAKVCAAEFKEFVDRLKLKFSSALSDTMYEIPDTIDELFNRFRVLAVGDELNQKKGLEILSGVDDIQGLVLQNLILSTLALSDMQMKSCRSLQTFRMYRQYREDILGKTFLEFQKKRLVNRRRGNHTSGPKKNRALPFVPMSFQLSQGYCRLFTWRFPSTICTESFQFLEKLHSYGSADQEDTFCFGDQMNDSPEDMLVFPLDGPGGQCVAILTLFLLGFLSVNVRIPDQIVVVDSTLVENEVMKSFGKDGLDDEDFEDEDDDSLGNKRKIEVKARQASHTNYLLMRGYCAPGIVSLRNLNPNDNVVVNSCHVRLKLRNTPTCGRVKCYGSFSDFFADMPSLPPLFTELVNPTDQNISTFLHQCTDGQQYTQEDLDSVQEIFNAIEAGSCLGMKVSDLGERFIKYEDVENGRTKSLQQYMQDLLTYRQVLQVGGACVRLVATSHSDPWVLHSYTLKEQDKALISKDSDGSELTQHASEDQANSDRTITEPPRKKTLVETADSENSNDAENPVVSGEPRASDSDLFTPKMDTGDSMGSIYERNSDCCFLGRPWRIVDGSLNKPVCKGMLEAVLYQVMTKPGITQQSLIQHYYDVLQPVVILELLQVLEQMGCIKKCYIAKPAKASLFSKPEIPAMYKSSKLSEDFTVFYEPSMDCTLRLGGIFPSEVNWNKWVM